jgi:Zinc finger, C2H2 type
VQELVLNLTGTAQSAKKTAKKPAKPATFQCELCPRRFTRAHNLRDHLRTHLDERPFVCISCGRAFTRRHDLNTHAALHLNEKKYVCAGGLRSGVRWGCGRKFDRQRNLKRHFKTEKGRSCVRPLLDEEEREVRASSSSEQLSPLIGSEVAQPAIDNNYNVDTDAVGLVKSQSYVSFGQLSGLTHPGLTSSSRVASEAEDQVPPSPLLWTPLRIEMPLSVKISVALGDSSSITRSQNHGRELDYPNPAL